MLKTLRKLTKDESGATAIEYGLIAALIAVALIAAATAVGDSLTGVFEEISTTLDSSVKK